MAYLKHKLGEWYCDAPRPTNKQPEVDADEQGALVSFAPSSEARSTSIIRKQKRIHAPAMSREKITFAIMGLELRILYPTLQLG
jgi:hypothetical protein